MAEALYTIDILRLAASTGKWPMLAAPLGLAERRSPTCGSRVRVGVTVDADGCIADLGLDLAACALGQASAALLAAHAPGRSLAALTAARAGLAAYLDGSAESLPDWPGLAQLAAARAYPARHPSILLAFDAAVAALTDAVSPAGSAARVGS